MAFITLQKICTKQLLRRLARLKGRKTSVPGRGALITSCNEDGSSWTLGRYVRSLHTSAEKVVLGVGYISDNKVLLF